MALLTRQSDRPFAHKPRTPRVLLHVLTSTLVTTALTFGLTGFAKAAPTPAEIEAEIDRQWNQLEPIIEEHNAVKVDLNANKAKVKALQDQIQPLAVKVDEAMNRVSVISAKRYMGGPASSFNAVLTTGSPAALADQLSLLNAVARNEAAQIRDVIDAKKQLDELKRPLDELVTKLSTQEADLATREKDINGQIKKLNEMRTAAYGTGVGTGSLKPVACPYEYSGGLAAKAAQIACAQISKPYVWAAEGPNSFDCSGLTMYAWAQAGVKTLRHYTKWQYQDTKRITRAELKAGDLVFFYSDMHHMGMYVGGGWIVHAPTTGDRVRMKKMDEYPIAGYGRVA